MRKPSLLDLFFAALYLYDFLIICYLYDPRHFSEHVQEMALGMFLSAWALLVLITIAWALAYPQNPKWVDLE